ncbi:hypothetical protein CEAn_00753 [Coxiella endosymbiont of Amblyomma nuttalli]|nr:hypothetical protein CEAn_00753 [Coxiella endosymbiont of Amblyomma nuttalli]
MSKKAIYDILFMSRIIYRDTYDTNRDDPAHYVCFIVIPSTVTMCSECMSY